MHKSARHRGTLDPDLDKCRTDRVGAVIPGSAREMFYCRIDNEECKFAMPFGFDYICQHLNNHDFPPSQDDDHGKVIAMFIAAPPTTFIKRHQ